MPKGVFPRKSKPAVERFERLFVPEPNSGCWIWAGALKPNGYGVFWVEARRIKKKSPNQAHRASWTIYRGPIPDEACVLHKCDMPACVNPDHLFLGSHSDNMQDCIRKKRLNRPAKLGLGQVIAIRASQATPTNIARQFGISATHACAIQKGRRRTGG